MKMKKVILIVLLFTAFVTSGNYAVAQNQNKNVKGKISGVVVDKSSGSPMENATIQLFRMKDSSLVTGGASDATGNFVIENVPGGRYNVLVSYIGYNNINLKNIAITSKSPTIDLGTINMHQSSEFTTEEIEVT